MSSVFWWLNLVRLYSLYKMLYPKRRIESYSIMVTIISPNRILLIWGIIGVPGGSFEKYQLSIKGLKPLNPKP